MTTIEELWFLIGIGGFLAFMEGAFSLIARLIARLFGKRISEDALKMIVGLVIFVLALIYLFNLPST